MPPRVPDFPRMGKIEHAKETRYVGIGILGYAFMGKAHAQAYIRMPFVFTHLARFNPNLNKQEKNKRSPILFI